jgi:hypothetical protein
MVGGYCGKNKDYTGNDDFITPKETWESIIPFIKNKNQIIYDPFYCDGSSGKIMTELGLTNVLHCDSDFFKNEEPYNMILSNIPFSIKKKILETLYILDKPFILIMPMEVLTYQYFKIWGNKIQLIIPNKRMNFYRKNGTLHKFNYDCIWFCYKMELARDIVFL